MRQKPMTLSDEAEKTVRDIKRATRRHFSAEDKIRIVIAGLRGEDSIADLDLPPKKWSSLRYCFAMEEDNDGKEETYSGRDCHEASDDSEGSRPLNPR